ncbi:MAG TPA: S41 family peptidase [Gemmatimonadaceae bacterium]|nr:S41 family peptidase [Gemmatimonadaceae bacterium]
MRSRAFVAVVVFGAALVSGGWLLQRGLEQAGPSPQSGAHLFQQVFQHVAREYVDSLGVDSLYRKAVDGMMGELGDPYSAYLSPDRLENLSISTSGSYGGLGIQIDLRDGDIVIVSPIAGTPAERAGIQPGDRIMAIDGRSTRGLTPDDALAALRGEPGTTVRITVNRPGVPDDLHFTVVRDEIHVNPVRRALTLAPGVGYVNLSVFSEAAATQLRQAVARLQESGMRTLLLDLRENPGGLLEQGVDVADLFLDPGQEIVSTRGRTPEATQSFVARTRQAWPDLPMIVLVDAHTASAAEIVAGALQDHDRAVLVGQPTFGKGVAQSVFPLGAGGALKLTTARWYTPSGRSIQRLPDSADVDDVPAPDSAGIDGDTAHRATFHTDAGRVVYGGGGIVPDLLASNADSSDAVLAFWRELGSNIPAFRNILTDFALSVKGAHAVSRPDFTVTPRMRQELLRRMTAAGITMSHESYEAAAPLVDRLIGTTVTRFVFGLDAEFLRGTHDDAILQRAMELARGVRSRRDLMQRTAAAAAHLPTHTAARRSIVAGVA